MASNNIIFAVPSANTSVDYTLPESDSAKLSFSPEDINGLKLDGAGGLVISFVEGGSVTISNFQSFIDNGNTLSLADGTQVDPKLLFNALGGQNDNPFPGDDAIRIGIPAENTTREITLEQGQKYVLNFDLSETQGADVKDGNMVISFANGGKIVINDYETVMASKLPPELSLASKTCVVTGDELITNIKALAAAGAIEETVVVVEEEETESKRKSKIADANMEGADDIGPGDETEQGYKAAKVEAKSDDAEKVAKVEPAAGDETEMAEAAQQLAEIETAAGGPAGGARNSGYGYSSQPGSDPFTGKPDIGPIDPTNLGYRAPELAPSPFFVPPAATVVPNNTPISITPNTKFLDETNLSGGPISESGKINVNFGADGPGGINSNGDFSSSGSRTADKLSHNGELITVTVVGNDYVGKTADGDLVFTLVVDAATGDYTFTQFLPLDHKDGTNPNDAINLVFGITAKDADGDPISTTVTIVIADDAPSIEGAEETVDETNLGPIVETGNLAVNFGEDGPGTVSTAGTFGATGSVKNDVLSSSGHPVTVTHTATGYEGVANGVVVFTLTISATGGYTYTQYANLDHKDNTNPNDIITLTFGAKVTDFDGDSANAPIVINIKDDAPRFTDCGCGHGPTPGEAVEIIDETNLGPIIETGTLSVDFGVDNPGNLAFTANSFVAGGSLKGDALTHNGIPIVVAIEGGNYVGKANGVTIFKLEINPTTGEYKFTLLDNLDHKDATDPNDIITLKFGVTASDFEGDTVQGSITINVKDDAPIANDDVNTFNVALGVANGNVVTGVNGGPGAADTLSQDDVNKVTKIAFGANEVDVPATGTVSIDGQFGKLTISADGTYSYVPFASTPGGSGGVATEKQFVSGGAPLPDMIGNLTPAEQAAKGIAPGNLSVTPGDTVQINFVSENGQNHNGLGVFTIDASGNLKMEKILVKDTETATMQTHSVTVPSGATDVGFFLVSGWDPINPAYEALDFSTGTLNFVYKVGTASARDALATDSQNNISLVYTSDTGVKTIIPGPVYFTSERGDATTLNPNNEVRVVSGIPEGDDTVLRIGFEDYTGDTDFNDVIFDVSIIDGCGCGCGKDDIRDQFVYTLVDGDGDKDTATLTLTGQDLTDDQPIFVAPGVEILDETALNTSTFLSETGNIVVNFGGDGPGTVGAAGTFTSAGSRLNDKLTSNGVDVVVTLLGGVYTGKAGDKTVFTLKINNNGSYEFKLFEQLDHKDGTDANDIIDLKFGILATDCDGDTSTTTLVVKVKDDAPDAKDDIVTLAENSTATGNVTDNDVPGQDTPAIVTQIVFKNVTYTVPATGNAVIVGDYGTLTISKTGAYTYVAKNVNASGQDDFIYTLKDFDGDTDTAKLSVCVTNNNDIPEIIKPADEIVDETTLSGGVITETGSVTANFFGDNPGTFGGNNSFASSGSRLNDALTHNGAPVNVTMSGNTYTGATAGGLVVFTLVINPTTGGYTFKLFENLDHKDGSNPDDIINLTFGIKATDSNNDSVSTTLTVKVKDDAPTISGSSGTVDETNLSSTTPLVHTGTLAHNFGQDGAGSLVVGTAAAFVAGGSLKNDVLSSNGVPVVVTLEGGKYVGKAGVTTVFTLTVNADGSYKYEQFKNLDHKDITNPNDEITLSFDAKIIDFDGDSAKAPIVITVRDDAPTFPPENPENPPEDPENPPGSNDPALGNAYRIVDETDLTPGGNIVKTGNLNADFGADVPGSYALKSGSFTSHGSKTNDALTSNGVPVVVTLEGGKFVGKAGTTTVFTLELTPSTGAYKFTLLDNLDHKDGTNPNDVINLVFGVEAKDSEGDAVTGTIRIDVRDDAPDARDDSATLNEGGTATGNVTDNDKSGNDTPATVTQVVFKGVTYTVPANGNVTIVGDYGTLSIGKSGAYTYVAKNINADGQDDFIYTLKDFDGDTDTAKLSLCVIDGNDIPQIIKPADEIVDETNLLSGVITETGSVTANFFSDGPGTFAANNIFSSSGSRANDKLTHMGTDVEVTLSGNTYTGMAGSIVVFTLVVNTNGEYTFKLFQQLDHANGSDPNDIINLNFGIKATDADNDSVSTTLTVKVKDDAPDAKNDTATLNEGGTATGNVTDNDITGQDVPAIVTQVTYKNVVYTVPSTGVATIVADHGTLKIDKTGAYTYTAKSNAGDGQDDFVYTLKDSDGDIDTATLALCVIDGNDIPQIVKPADEIIDETDLKNGVITETGKVTADFFGDSPGTFAINNTFTSSGSRLGDVLKSNGVLVNVTYSGNNTYTGMAGSTVVFTLVVASNGDYTFKLYEQLDHKDGNNANDIINLNFGIKATDSNNDSVSTTLTVQVKDDAPVGVADYCTLIISQKQYSSNVLSNDVIGQDTPGKITAITFGNTTVNVPATGTVTINSLYGQITIAASGAYTYKITNPDAPTTTETFTIKTTDFDGDSATSVLEVNLIGDDLSGTSGKDVIYGSSGNDVILGNGGEDSLYGQHGDDTIRGGDGNDTIEGGLGKDKLYGDAGNDLVIGRHDDDIIYGGAGNDNLLGDGYQEDTYIGNDTIYGEAGNDYVFGGGGNDYIDGGIDNDTLYGGDGNDTILGGAGADHLIGQKGNDILTGGTGADTFWFMNVNEGVDRITDFNKAEGDKLNLSNVITNFDPVTDAINNFVFAQTSGGNTTILVNNAGTGIGGATAVAVLEGVSTNVTDLFNSGAIIH